MRSYETLFIIKPELSEEEIEAVVAKMTKLLEEQGAQEISVDTWGMRELAYEIQKFRQGFYVLVNFNAEPGAVDELERVFKISPEILRYMVVNKDQKAG